MESQAESGLRRYTHSVAVGLDIGPESTWCEVDSGADTYVTLDERLPAVPNRGAALTWNSRRGWAVGVEYAGGARVLVLAYLGECLLPVPEQVVAFAKKALTGYGASSPFPLAPNDPNVMRDLTGYVCGAWDMTRHQLHSNDQSTKKDRVTGKQQHEASEGEGKQVLGVVADPDMPALIGSRLASRLTEWLDERTSEAWRVEVVSDALTAGESDTDRILQTAEAHRDRHGWTYVVCLSDLPVLLPRGALLCEVSTSRRSALVSAPALGGIQPFRRTRQVLMQVVEDMLNAPRETERDSRQHQMRSWLTGRLAPIHRNTRPSAEVDVRYTSGRVRGWLRLLSGMVRANRPWQLVWGLSSALAAALAAAGFGIFTSTVWRVGDMIGPVRGSAATVLSLALMVVWLTASHGLWERLGKRAERDRRLAVLYNASTLTTLAAGVACLYAVVFSISAIASGFVLVPSVVASALGHQVSVSTYLSLAWMVATMALVAGALGSSLESDAAVRQTAYGYREQQRRKQDAQV